MGQSEPDSPCWPGLHVAVIMDGNGRWATARGLPRAAGHREGAHAVRRVVEAAPECGVGTLTLYAFSADNWRRPADEVDWLMQLFARHLRSERRRCVEAGVRVTILGRRDRLPAALLKEIDTTERATTGCRRLHLRLAVDYSARTAIVEAARAVGSAALTPEALDAALTAAPGGGDAAPPVDLLLRTGGEQRLSDFLLWECAYAELLFLPIGWPDFTASDLRVAVDTFRGRERRFGGLPVTTVLRTGAIP